MTLTAFFVAAAVPVIGIAVWAVLLVMREAARVHSFDRDFSGMHFE